MVQSKVVEEVIYTEQEEMESILLPTSEKTRKEMIEYIKNCDNSEVKSRTCIGVIIDTETGEITYAGILNVD